MYTGNRMLRRLKSVLLTLPLICLAIVLMYIAYLFMTYHRLPNTSEQHSKRTTNPAPIDETYTALTWNLGFGAYNRDFSFFMDGGKEGRARSIQHVYDNLVHCVDLVAQQKPDFVLFQEVDRKADRSWKVDEADVIREVLEDYQDYYAQNFNSPYIVLPFSGPHGAAKSGIITFSNRDIFSAERFSLPVEEDWHKLLDLDRCYTVCHIPTDKGHELCVFNLHLSAYTSNGSIVTEQLEMLAANMKKEFRRGNYVVVGGDFNKDLLGDSAAIFGVKNRNYTWAQPIDLSLIPEGFTLVDSLDRDNPVPTCRNCDTGYIPGKTFVTVTDGFIVSDNIEVLDCHVIDDDFQCTDHNPVILKFRLVAPKPAVSAKPNTTKAPEDRQDELGSH